MFLSSTKDGLADYVLRKQCIPQTQGPTAIAHAHRHPAGPVHTTPVAPAGHKGSQRKPTFTLLAGP